jgi:TPR repeat protein
MYGGFGVRKRYQIKAQCKWIKKAAEHGSYIAMAVYARVSKIRDPVNHEFWMGHVLSSNDNLALGYYYLCIKNNAEKALPFLEKSAKEGNEYGQYWLNDAIVQKESIPLKGSWLEKAAKQGLYVAQYKIGEEFVDTYWKKRADKQWFYF